MQLDLSTLAVILSVLAGITKLLYEWVGDLKDANDRLLLRIDNLSGSYTREQQNHMQTQSNVRTLQGEVDRLQKIVEQEQIKNDLQRAQYDRLLKRVSDTEDRLEVAAAELHAVKQKHTELDQNYRGLQGKHDKLSDQFSDAKRKNDELSGTVQKKETVIREQYVQIDRLQKTVQTKDVEVKALMTDIEHRNAVIEELRDLVRNQQDRIKVLESDVREIKTQYQTVAEQLASIDRTLNSMTSEGG